MGPTAEPFDVVVVGGGPAGLAAAAAAGENRRRVLLLERRPYLGGNVWARSTGELPSRELEEARTRLERAGVRLMLGTEVLEQPRPSALRLGSDGGVVEVEYARLVLATGARERFLPFPGWTLPNVTGAGGLQLLVKGGLSVQGRSVVVAGSGPLLFAVAVFLRHHGAAVRLIAEQAPRRRMLRLAVGLVGVPARLRQTVELQRELRGIPYRTGCWPVRAEGDGRVERVRLRQNGREWVVECDFLACGFHLVPNLEVAELLGCRIDGGRVVANEYQETSVPGIFVAGETAGVGGRDLASVEGAIAGLAAAGRPSEAALLLPRRRQLARFRDALDRTFRLDDRLRSNLRADTVVCRCEDVTAGDVSSFRSGREARLQSRCGMGRCQGRVCGPACEFLWGWNPRGHRPPLVPTTVGQLVSR